MQWSRCSGRQVAGSTLESYKSQSFDRLNESSFALRLVAGKPRGWLHVQFDSEEAVERACRLSGAQLLDRPVYVQENTGGRAPKPEPGKPVEGCWFCLSNPTADTELIVSIGEPPNLTQSLLLCGPCDPQDLTVMVH